MISVLTQETPNKHHGITATRRLQAPETWRLVAFLPRHTAEHSNSDRASAKEHCAGLLVPGCGSVGGPLNTRKKGFATTVAQKTRPCVS